VSASSELAERIDFAKRFFTERRRLWLFVLFDEWISPEIDARAVFARQHLRFVQDSIGEAVESGRHWDSPASTYIGYLENEAVSTAMTRPVDDVLFVGWVATKPSRQGQGCAEALMRHALEHHRRKAGQMKSVLHSTPAGLKLYERLGYRRVARFELYLGGSLPKS
jgi:ribosomal protein S18 acetylase RimI-like enzyme